MYPNICNIYNMDRSLITDSALKSVGLLFSDHLAEIFIFAQPRQHSPQLAAPPTVGCSTVGCTTHSGLSGHLTPVQPPSYPPVQCFGLFATLSDLSDGVPCSRVSKSEGSDFSMEASSARLKHQTITIKLWLAAPLMA